MMDAGRVIGMRGSDADSGIADNPGATLLLNPRAFTGTYPVEALQPEFKGRRIGDAES